MKKQSNKSLLMLALVSAMSSQVFAQNNQPGENNPTEITQGNTFERETTPLLREISRKKSQLELRRLDRELEKMDEDSLKAQMSMETLLKGDKSAETGSASNSLATMPGSSPLGLPAPTVTSAMPVSVPGMPAIGTAANPFEGNSDIKVLMIYGFDDNLHAKVLSGDQGGYVVKKGDVMPNGQIVHNVTANYLEVRKGPAKGKNSVVQRIFVSSSIPTATVNSMPSPGGVSGSNTISIPMPVQSAPTANDLVAAKVLAPMTAPGKR
jgi:hypothetical protein